MSLTSIHHLIHAALLITGNVIWLQPTTLLVHLPFHFFNFAFPSYFVSHYCCGRVLNARMMYSIEEFVFLSRAASFDCGFRFIQFVGWKMNTSRPLTNISSISCCLFLNFRSSLSLKFSRLPFINSPSSAIMGRNPNWQNNLCPTKICGRLSDWLRLKTKESSRVQPCLRRLISRTAAGNRACNFSCPIWQVFMSLPLR